MWATQTKEFNERGTQHGVNPQDQHVALGWRDESGTSLHRWDLSGSLHPSLWFPCQAPLADWLYEVLLSSQWRQATAAIVVLTPAVKVQGDDSSPPAAARRLNCCRIKVWLWGAWLCLLHWNISPAWFGLWPPEIKLLEYLMWIASFFPPDSDLRRANLFTTSPKIRFQKSKDFVSV